MKQSILRRSFALMLIASFLLCFAAPALAASYVTANRDTVVRSSASSSGKEIGTLYAGSEVQRLGTFGSFTKITFEGRNGYVLTGHVNASVGNSLGSLPPTSIGNATATGTVKVRSGPGTNYTQLGQLKKGEAVVVVGSVNDWTIINWKDGTAYVSTKYLSLGGSGSSSSASGSWIAVTGTVNVRSGPGTNYTIVGSLNSGAKAQKTGTFGSWTKIVYNGSVAYVFTKYTTATTAPGGSTGGGSTGSSAGRFVFATSSVPIYNTPATSGGVQGYLYQGNSAEYLGRSGTYIMISYNGIIGYVSSFRVVLLDNINSELAYDYHGWMYASANGVVVYSVPSAVSSYKIDTLNRNEAVYVISYNSTWAQVIVDDDFTGYVKWNSLKKSSSGSSNSSGGSSSSNTNNIVFKYNETLYVRNASYTDARVYVDYLTGSARYRAYQAAGYIAGTSTPVDYTIPYATRVTVKITAVGDLIYVTWTDNKFYALTNQSDTSTYPATDKKTTHAAWVNVEDLSR